MWAEEPQAVPPPNLLLRVGDPPEPKGMQYWGQMQGESKMSKESALSPLDKRKRFLLNQQQLGIQPSNT